MARELEDHPAVAVEAPASPVARMLAISPELEFWWDSSPLVFSAWRQAFVAAQPAPARRAQLEAQLQHLFDPADSARTLIAGVTTNPPLSLQAVEQSQTEWDLWTDRLIRRNPGKGPQQLWFDLYKEVVRRGAETMLAHYYASGKRRGYLSGQVDARLATNLDAMLAQAHQLHSVNPNVMVKMPGTKEGIEGIRILTSEGIPTNATLTFVLPQLIAVAEAVKAGLREARAQGVDLSGWRSVVTMMLGRYEDCTVFKEDAARVGVHLAEDDIRWAGPAIVKKAYRIFQKRGYESKMLAASMRVGPTLNGQTQVRHITTFAGGNVVLTVFPNIYEAFLTHYAECEIRPQMDDAVPAATLEKLRKVPYFARAYDEHGYAPEEFITHQALIDTRQQFSEAAEKLEAYIASRLR